MKKITLEIANMMALGSSIYSTGGGFDLAVQLKLFKKLFETHKNLPLISIDELSDDDYICTAYGVGSAGNTDFDLSTPLKTGLEILEKHTGKKFKAIFAGETNIDVLAFQAAANVRLPVLDADCTGGRAVPEIQFDNFLISNKSILPLVAVTLEGEAAVLAKSRDGKTIETFVRNFATASKSGVVAVLDHPIQVKEAKKILTLGIFDRAIRLGTLVQTSEKNQTLVEKIIKEIKGTLLIEGTVTQVVRKDNREEGFLTGHYVITDEKKNTLKVSIKNENVVCWKNGKVLLTPPDCIYTLDVKTFEGVHNSKISEGQQVAIIAAPATPLWRSNAGVTCFSAKILGIDEPTTLLTK